MPREAMEAYARKHVRIADEIQIGGVHIKHARLDEVAGAAFAALDLVLTITEEMRADASMPVDPELPESKTLEILADKRYQCSIAELIEQTILKELS
jgi:hypothetical protein